MFDIQLYQQVWHRLNRSQIITQTDSISLLSLSVSDRLNSTNTKLWELINRSESIPLGAIAVEQTAGKGQWGNSWISARGGLYLSVALNVDLELGNNQHLVMATAWGIAKVLRYYRLPVKIKWSNDLILQQRKLGGIKIETRNLASRLKTAVVGVGINWRNPVPKTGINLESYYQNQSRQYIESLEELAAMTAYGILQGHNYYLQVGIERLLSEYLPISDSLGKQITIDNYPGEVVGVTRDGKLQVRFLGEASEATGEIAIAPGQISLGY